MITFCNKNILQIKTSFATVYIFKLNFSFNIKKKTHGLLGEVLIYINRIQNLILIYVKKTLNEIIDKNFESEKKSINSNENYWGKNIFK